jgi:hypothetical protein
MSWYRRLFYAWLARPRRLVIATVVALAGTGALAASAMATPPDISANYTFVTLDNEADVTFNQLLGINDSGLITGYFGSGLVVNGVLHPNKGYRLAAPYGQHEYKNENFPGSVQTQVTGLNNGCITVGFWADKAGDNFGFYRCRGHFHEVNFPAHNPANPAVDQLLGVNDDDLAVGFYTDKSGMNHGYTYDIRSHRFHRVQVSGDSNVTAAAINDAGDIAGVATNGASDTEGFLLLHDGQVVHLDVPGATSTEALGVNNQDEVVGQYTVGTGSGATTYGFVWLRGIGFLTVNDPNGLGATTVNGINDKGDLVGFYTDSLGNVDGMHAIPLNG